MRPPLASTVLEKTSEYFDVSTEELTSIHKTDTRRVTTARHVAMYLMHRHSLMSTIEIALVFDCDHSSVGYAARKVSARVGGLGDPVRRQVEDVEALLSGVSTG